MQVTVIPPRMDAAIDHDGASWRFGGNRLASLLSAFALISVLLGAASMRPVALGVAAFACPILLLLLVQSFARTTISVTSRAVSIERRSISGLHRESVRIDEITAQSVATNKSGDVALVLKTRDETVIIGSGQRPEHLEWLLQVVAHARSLSAEREQKEGREWGFLRKAPEALQRVRDTS